MIHPALKGKKLVFDVEGKPELKAAISKRLREIGAVGPMLSTEQDETIRLYADGSYDFYPMPPDMVHDFNSAQITTLSDLYDLPERPALQLEVGKWYRRANGSIVGPIFDKGNGAFEAGNSLYKYFSDGKCEGRGGALDLVSEAGPVITLVDGTVREVTPEQYEQLRGAA